MRGRVPVSPILPAVANLLLGALWVLSVFAGWGLRAFCGETDPTAACVGRLEVAGGVSEGLAFVAACCTAGALLPPLIHRRPGRSLALLVAGSAAWVLALAVLFLAGLTVPGRA